MSITIAAGWWLLPTVLTIIIASIWGAWQSKQPPASGYGNIGKGIGELVVFMAALLSVAAIWIVYLTVRLWVA